MANRIKFVANSVQIMTFEISNLTGTPLTSENVSSISWRMARYGTYEKILERTMIDGVTIVGNIVTVVLSEENTASLSGLFIHQLTIVDDLGNTYVVDEGQILIIPYVQ